MAREVSEVIEGVSQTSFNTHTHNYRKITDIGIDVSKLYTGPVKSAISDDAETVITDGNDAEAIGVTVSTQPTEVPN